METGTNSQLAQEIDFMSNTNTTAGESFAHTHSLVLLVRVDHNPSVRNNVVQASATAIENHCADVHQCEYKR